MKLNAGVEINTCRKNRCALAKIFDYFTIKIFITQIFVASVNTWIIVHFHHYVVAVNLFQIYTVKTLTHHATRFQRDFPEPLWSIHFLHGDGPAPREGRFAAKFSAVFPSTLRNHVLTNVEDIVVEHANPPVKSCGRKLLHSKHIRFLKETLCNIAKARFACSFLHIFAKARIGRFYNDWFSKSIKDI